MERCTRALDSERLPWPTAFTGFQAIAAGLVAIHQSGIVHRDIKPSNLFVAADGTVRIGDFGLVGRDAAPTSTSDQQLDGRDGTQTGIVGTPAFMAPELLEGGKHTPATDQYAFFASLFWVVAGGSPTAPAVWPAGSAPAWLRRVVERGLSGDSRKRFATMDAAKIALRGPGWVRRPWVPAALAASAGAAAWLAIPTAGPDCANVGVMAWTASDSEALRTAVADAPERSATANSLNEGLSGYAAATETMARTLCEAQTRAEPGSAGRQCLARHAERVRAIAHRLTVRPVRDEGIARVASLMPELLSFEHCGRTHEGYKTPDPRRAGVAAAVHGAFAQSLLGDVTQGMAMLEAALDREDIVAFPDLYAVALQRRASNQIRGLGPTSETTPREALAAAARLSAVGDDPAVDARVWCELANLEASSSNFGEADHDLSFAYAALARAGTPAPESVCCSLLEGRRRQRDGDLAGALELARAAEAAATDLGSNRLLIHALIRQGSIISSGRIAEGVDVLTRARALALATHGPAHADTAEVEFELGWALLRAERDEEAAAVFGQSAAHRKPESLQWALVIHGLGLAYLHMGRFENAHERLLSARRVFSARKDEIRVAGSDHALAQIAVGRGDTATARMLLHSAVVALETELGPDHDSTVRARSMLEKLGATDNVQQ